MRVNWWWSQTDTSLFIGPIRSEAMDEGTSGMVGASPQDVSCISEDREGEAGESMSNCRSGRMTQSGLLYCRMFS